MSAEEDITRNFHRGNPESTEAWWSIADRVDIDRLRVITYVASQGRHGATCDETEQALGMSHQTTSARFTEAKVRGDIVHEGDRRKTRSGRYAAVWVVPEDQMELW